MGLEFAHLLRYGLVVASIGAGILHLTAVPAHSAHTLLYAFFIGSGMLQIAWAGAVLASRPAMPLFEVGMLGNIGLIGVWVVSRMAGIPIEGAEHAEPIGVKDSVTVIFEVLVVVGAYVLVTRRDSTVLRSRISHRMLAPLSAATALLLVPGLVVPAHQHVHDPSHRHGAMAAGHEHVAGARAHGHKLAAAHSHDAEAVKHGHSADAKHEMGAHEHNAPPARRAAASRAAASRSSAPGEVTGIATSVRYGPFVLPPASLGGDAHYNRILQNVAKPCSNCYIVQATPNLVYQDGRSANISTGAMLHHAVWTRPSIQDTTCNRNSAIGSQGMRFFASGNERTSMHVPAGFGYHVGTDPWSLIVEIMNHSEEAKSLYITLDVLYRPGSDKVHNVTPVWMDIDNCGDSQFAIPAGKSHTTWRWTSSITGRVVSTGGHVHDSGIKTVLTNESTKQEMCTSMAGYGRKAEFDGTIESMSICVWDRIGIVRKGEQLGIHAYYNSAEAKNDVMGINIALVYETSNLSGGTVPPKQEQQEADPHSGGHDH